MAPFGQGCEVGTLREGREQGQNLGHGPQGAGRGRSSGAALRGSPGGRPPPRGLPEAACVSPAPEERGRVCRVPRRGGAHLLRRLPPGLPPGLPVPAAPGHSQVSPARWPPRLPPPASMASSTQRTPTLGRRLPRSLSVPWLGGRTSFTSLDSEAGAWVLSPHLPVCPHCSPITPQAWPGGGPRGQRRKTNGYPVSSHSSPNSPRPPGPPLLARSSSESGRVCPSQAGYPSGVGFLALPAPPSPNLSHQLPQQEGKSGGGTSDPLLSWPSPLSDPDQVACLCPRCLSLEREGWGCCLPSCP